jgi:hypothetical protein
MRTLLVMLGLCSLLLMPLPYLADGGPAQARQVGFASWYSILKFFQVDKAGMFRMTSTARYFK